VLFQNRYIFRLACAKGAFDATAPKTPLGRWFIDPLGANGPTGLAHWVNPQTHWIEWPNGPGTLTHWVPFDSLTHWVQLDPLTHWVPVPGVHGGEGVRGGRGGRGRADGVMVTATMEPQTP